LTAGLAGARILDGMRLLVPVLLFAAATAPRGGCGGDQSPGGSPYDPCSGKVCGASCHLCAPDAKECVEPAVVLTCDADAKCLAAGTGRACFDPCLGKHCGESCDPCAPGLPCPMNPVASQCDGAGRCVLPGNGTSCTACEGKTCGTPCTIDPPCYPLCLMPSLLGTCDGNGTCVPPGSVGCR
jgi:hypothetical protein